MKFTNRELILAWLTAVALLCAGAYLIIDPRLKAWKGVRVRQDEVAHRIELDQRLVTQGPKWQAQLDERLKGLPRYAAGKDVTADLLISLEKVAGENSLNLVKREAQKEEKHGELYQLAIVCKWEGDLRAITHFLVALQSEGAMLDVSQLSITPEGKGKFKGGFTVDGAYSREGAVGPPKTPPATDQKKRDASL